LALCPFARHRLIPESYSQGRINPRVLIFHQAVSTAESLYGYWTSPGVELESHFYVYKDGSLDQYVDTEVRADANVEANGFAVSVETWDNGGSDEPWTDAQLATLTRLAAWVSEVHGIPAVVPSGPYGSGIGWHNLYPDEWAGGPRACPGNHRIAQVRNHIIPTVAAGGGWQEEDMQADERAALFRIKEILEVFNKGATKRLPAGWGIDMFAQFLYEAVISMHRHGFKPMAEGALGGDLSWFDTKLTDALSKSDKAVLDGVARIVEAHQTQVELTPEQAQTLFDAFPPVVAQALRDAAARVATG
jgi:hypothetical protein